MLYVNFFAYVCSIKTPKTTNAMKNIELVEQLCLSYKPLLNDLYKDFASSKLPVNRDARNWANLVKESLSGIGAKKLNDCLVNKMNAVYYVNAAARKANKAASAPARTFMRNVMLEERGISQVQFNEMH